jgi:hypothetical protein
MGMTGTVRAAISDEQVLQPNSLASVSSNYIVIRNRDRRSTTIIPLARVAEIRGTYNRYPVLLVISVGVLLMAAAAVSSKEGGRAPMPLALVGLCLLWLYFDSRKAVITLVLDSGSTETITGRPHEAQALITLIEFAQRSQWVGWVGSAAQFYPTRL